MEDRAACSHRSVVLGGGEQAAGTGELGTAELAGGPKEVRHRRYVPVPSNPAGTVSGSTPLGAISRSDPGQATGRSQRKAATSRSSQGLLVDTSPRSLKQGSPGDDHDHHQGWNRDLPKDWGEGPVVTFSHGWPLSADAWDGQMLFLAQNGFRVIAHDRRGHGRSSQASSGNDMDGYADDLAAVIEALDLRDATLVGHSTGGGEVPRYIGRHGTMRVAKAVLVSAVPPIMLQSAANPEGLPMECSTGSVRALPRTARSSTGSPCRRACPGTVSRRRCAPPRRDPPGNAGGRF